MLCYPFPSRQVNGRIVARMGHVTLAAWTFSENFSCLLSQPRQIFCESEWLEDGNCDNG